jgi:prophage DNA circulation protein
MKILDLDSPWRNALLPASYKNCEFHVEAMTFDGGRRNVPHEFPKKDRPYVEDMGRRAFNATVRGYCISFPVNTVYPLYRKDYRVARDLLHDALQAGGPGRLQLPSLPAMIVAVDRYRLSEESRLGGYCTFDMTFVEQGEPPPPPAVASRQVLISQSGIMIQRVVANLSGVP